MLDGWVMFGDLLVQKKLLLLGKTFFLFSVQNSIYRIKYSTYTL